MPIEVLSSFFFFLRDDRNLNCVSTLKDYIQAVIFLNYSEDTCI